MNEIQYRPDLVMDKCWLRKDNHKVVEVFRPIHQEDWTEYRKVRKCVHKQITDSWGNACIETECNVPQK